MKLSAFTFRWSVAALLPLMPLMLAAGAMAELPEWRGRTDAAEPGTRVADLAATADATHLVAALEDGHLAGFEMGPQGSLTERWRLTVSGAHRLTDADIEDGVIAVAAYDQGLHCFTGDGATTPAAAGSVAAGDGMMLSVALHDGFIYAAAGYGGLRLFDATMGLPPTPIGAIATQGHAERLRRFGDTLILSEGRNGLTMFHIDAPGALTPLGSLLVSGRIEDFALAGERLAVAAGSDGLLLFDVSNPGAPQALDWRGEWSCTRVEAFDGGVAAGGWTLATWGIGANGLLIPRAQILAEGGAAAMAALGGRMAVGNFDGAINVFDLAGRQTPQPAFLFDTGRIVEQFAFSSRWVAGTGPRSRLWFFEWSENDQSAAFLHDQLGHTFSEIQIEGDTVWTGDADRALEQWRYDEALKRFALTWAETGLAGNAADFERDGDLLYVAARNYGWRVYSLADEIAPELIAQPGSPIVVDQSAMGGGRLYARYQFQGVQAFSLDDPLAPQPRGQIYPWLPFHIAAREDFLFLARRRYGLEIWNFNNPDAPQLAGHVPLFDARMTLPVNDRFALVAEGPMGAAVVDWSDPAAPALVCRLALGDGAPVMWLHRDANRIGASSGNRIVFLPTGDIFQAVDFEGDLWLLN